MGEYWDQARIQQFIENNDEESLTLEYKRSESLGKSDAKKAEITKDVSAMANSAGGTIIYGIAEYQQVDKRHLPEKIDPVDNTQFSKEWLEQVISNIRPKIDNLIIHPVTTNTAPNHYVYIVEVPQSSTAHQATDKRYYKRFNFESVAMEDYEIRDVMNRGKQPKIELDFVIEVRKEHPIPSMPIGDPTNVYYLKIRATNVANVYANYVNCIIYLPISFRPTNGINLMMTGKDIFQEDGEYFYEYYRENTVRDIIDKEKYGMSRYSPILPGRSHEWETQITNDMNQIRAMKQGNVQIKWAVYADNAPVNRSITPVAKIPIHNRR